MLPFKGQDYNVELLHGCVVMSPRGWDLARYTTISVPAEVKKALEHAKGKREWGEFLLNLYNEVKKLRSKRAFEELANSLTEKDLQVMLESSRELRERLTFR